MNEKQEQTLRKIAKKYVKAMLSKKSKFDVVNDIFNLHDKIGKGGTDEYLVLFMAQEVGYELAPSGCGWIKI